jgi:hypothetical protein
MFEAFLSCTKRDFLKKMNRFVQSPAALGIG